MRVFINGEEITDVIAFEGVEITYNDVDGPNSGRNIKGDMIRDFLAKKIRANITCRPIHLERLRQVLNLIAPVFVTVTFDDPAVGTVQKVMYSNNYGARFFIHRGDDDEIWKDLQFPLIEK